MSLRTSCTAVCDQQKIVVNVKEIAQERMVGGGTTALRNYRLTRVPGSEKIPFALHAPRAEYLAISI
jgi:hypothetical protein